MNNSLIIEDDISKIKAIMYQNIDFDIDIFKEDALNYIKAPSKFLRSKMCVLFQRACFKDCPQEIYYLGASIELAHNASLLHDDVIDDANIRRNQVSFNTKTNSKIAILFGDLLLAKSLFLIDKIHNQTLYNLFAQALDNMSYGEITQYYNRYKPITLEQYFQKNYQKTGMLFKIAITTPFILKNENKNLEKTNKFVKHFSNAFQIKDDMANYFSTKTDKPVKTDEQQGIYTLPVILKNQNPKCKVYEECCKILEHQVKLALENLSFIEENKYKQIIVSICNNLLRDMQSGQI